MKIKNKIIGKKITLKTCTLEQCTNNYVSWLNDPSINQYLESRFIEHTLESTADFICQNIDSKDTYLFAMITEQGKHIGNIKLGPIHPIYLYANIGYFIGESSFWRQGIATEAIKIVKDFAFEELNLHRVQAGVFEKNSGSIRAIEKNGFLLEGTFKKQLLDKNGDWQDHLFFGILNPN